VGGFFDVFYEIFPKYREGNQYKVTATSALSRKERVKKLYNFCNDGSLINFHIYVYEREGEAYCKLFISTYIAYDKLFACIYIYIYYYYLIMFGCLALTASCFDKIGGLQFLA
jgi:hypothetical protein